MVENQQSIKTVLSFGAKSVEPEILEKLLVGRNDTALQLTNSIESIALNNNNQQILIVGQRGMGKTHLLRILYHRATVFVKERKIHIAYFTEEEYGIVDFFDFLTRVFYAFLRWNTEDQSWLQPKLEELQNTTQSLQLRLLENMIKEYIGNRPLLILAENFGDILNSMGREEQGKLRTWLYENDRISIIASCQNLSEDFDREDRPFYGFFTIYYLKSLTLEESIEFLVSLAALDGREDVKNYILTKGKGRVRAVHDLVKGNHRLLVTFYEFLKTDTLASLSNQFIKTINDLKPYYETFIRYLPPQQQKIVRFLALARKPQLGIDIGKHCFIEQSSLNKQISELTRKGLLEVLPDKRDKRNKLYDINEPLLRISIEIGEHKEGITALFIDFLALFYDEDELHHKKNRFQSLLTGCTTTQEQQYLNYEIQAIDRALAQKYKPKDIGAFWNLVAGALTKLKGNDDLKWLAKWRNIVPADEFNMGKGILLGFHGKLKEAANTFSKVTERYELYGSTLGSWAVALCQLAQTEKDERKFKLAFEKFKKAEELGETENDLLYWSWGIALFGYAELTQEPRDYNDAVKVSKKAIKLKPSTISYYTTLAERCISVGNPFENPESLHEAISALRAALSLDGNDETSIFLLGGIINYFSEADGMEESIKELLSMTLSRWAASARVQIWQKFKRLERPELFLLLSDQLKLDIDAKKKERIPILIEWVTSIMSSKLYTLSRSELEKIELIVASYVSRFPELKILMMYLEVYGKVIIEQNANAIYDLPKEQRLFFEKHILHKNGYD